MPTLVSHFYNSLTVSVGLKKTERKLLSSVRLVTLWTVNTVIFYTLYSEHRFFPRFPRYSPALSSSRVHRQPLSRPTRLESPDKLIVSIQFTIFHKQENTPRISTGCASFCTSGFRILLHFKYCSISFFHFSLISQTLECTFPLYVSLLR